MVLKYSLGVLFITFLKNLGKVISCAPKIQSHGLILLCPGVCLRFSRDQMAEAMK